MRTFNTNCPICHNPSIIQVPDHEYMEWQLGAYIQDAMPSLTADEREQLLTGICPDCWADSFGEDE